MTKRRVVPITELPRVACDCETGASWCEQRPCWPTPGEARAIQTAGLGHRLMRDYWLGDNFVEILSPAIVGYEGKAAPFWPKGCCTFFTADRRCELHPLGLKPIEGAVTCCQAKRQSGSDLHKQVAELWLKEKSR